MCSSGTPLPPYAACSRSSHSAIMCDGRDEETKGTHGKSNPRNRRKGSPSPPALLSLPLSLSVCVPLSLRGCGGNDVSNDNGFAAVTPESADTGNAVSHVHTDTHTDTHVHVHVDTRTYVGGTASLSPFPFWRLAHSSLRPFSHAPLLAAVCCLRIAFPLLLLTSSLGPRSSSSPSPSSSAASSDVIEHRACHWSAAGDHEGRRAELLFSRGGCHGGERPGSGSRRHRVSVLPLSR